MANKAHLAVLKQGVEVWNNWRQENPNVIPDLSGADLNGSALHWLNLKGANLRKASLRAVNLREAILTQAELVSANLNRANLSEADLFMADLFKTNLIEADLRGAYFVWANLSGADLSGANLSEADLSKTQALGTNFSRVKFTGACLQDWSINSETNLKGVIADYVYLKANRQERRPHDPNKNFATREFTKLFQKALETVDLIFSDGIDWQAFLTSFQNLQVECGSSELAIQAIERKSGGAFVVRVEVPADANKAEIEKFFKRKYGLALKAKEEEYKKLLQAKDKDIAYFHQQNTNLLEIIRLQASKPINITQIQENNMAGDRNIHMGSGNYNEKIEGNYVQGNYYAAGEKPNLAEAAAEIQALLKQLEQTYPTNTTSDQMIVAAEAIKHIENDPTWKQRVINAAKEGGLAALEKALDNPVGALITGAIKGWLEAKAE